MILFDAIAGNDDAGDAVTRAHLWDVPACTDANAQHVPGMFYDSTENLAGLGNTILEVFALPGVVMQRATAIDSGAIAIRRYYGGAWSSWATVG